MSFWLIKYFTNKVDQTLHFVSVPGFLTFDDDSCAHDARSGDDVY